LKKQQNSKMQNIINTVKKKIALIYCRVSSERQVKDGNGLDSQEKRCRDYATQKGYVISEVFRDEGISGGKADRPAIAELIDYIDDHPLEDIVVIFDDLSRLARDVAVYIQLTKALKSRGVTIECLNFNFDDSPEGEYAELIMASSNQLFRKQNKRQVIQKQKSRLEDGYWPFCNPPAFKFVKDREKGRGKILVYNEPITKIHKSAFEQYDADILNTYDEVRDYVRSEYKKQGVNKLFGRNGAIYMLSNVLYCGDIAYKPWGVERRKGKHKGFISVEMFERVQLKMKGRAKAKARKDYSLDFALRRFATCSQCGEFLTGSFSKGEHGKLYPHYWCKTEGCPLRYTTIRNGDIDTSFENILTKAKPKKTVLELTHEVLQRCWNNKIKAHELTHASTIKELAQVSKQIDGYMARLGNTQNEDLVTMYEETLTNLVKAKKDLSGKIGVNPYTEKSLGTATNKVFKAIENPLGMWKTDSIEDKRTVLGMFFEGKLPYDMKNGFGTPKFSDGYNVIKSLESSKGSLVEMAGIEPTS